MKMTSGVLTLAIMGLVAFGTAHAESKQTNIEKGAAHYRIFCINCHGEKADGNGQLAELMKIKPVDLTTLNQSPGNDLTILERVFRAVDGRHEVGEGNERKMPVFTDNLAVQTVYEVAEFIEAIQK